MPYARANQNGREPRSSVTPTSPPLALPEPGGTLTSTPSARHSSACPLTPVPATPKSPRQRTRRSEEHTSELQSQFHLVCRLLLEKKKTKKYKNRKHHKTRKNNNKR